MSASVRGVGAERANEPGDDHVGVQSAAQSAAVLAAGRAGVEIRELTDASSQAEARRVFDQVWPSEDGTTQVRPNLLRALVHAGGYCVGAYDMSSGEILGATLALYGQTHDPHVLGAPEATPPGQPLSFLHSHMAGVLDHARNRRIGTAMKLHQRWWALTREIPVVTWTFDPLVRRNARLNLCNLGVQVARYHVNFYGEMHDAINAGDPTDRVVAWWELGSARATRAAAGELAPLSHPQCVADTRCVVIDTPEDIVALRASDPAAAREWRLRVRSALTDGFASGLVVDGFTDAGAYVLRAPKPAAP